VQVVDDYDGRSLGADLRDQRQQLLRRGGHRSRPTAVRRAQLPRDPGPPRIVGGLADAERVEQRQQREGLAELLPRAQIKVIDAALTDPEPLTCTKAACALLGTPRASLYRRRNPKPPGGKPPRAPRRAHPAELDDAERAELLAVLNSERFVDRSPAQVWATLLDEGVYLASVSTMYRLLRAHQQTRERRA